MEVVALLAAIVLFTVAAACGVSIIGHTAQGRPIDPGTHPAAWMQPARPQPVAPASVTTTNVYIDTVNVYQAAPPAELRLMPLEQPQTVPAEVRRIRPAIGR